MFVCGFGVSVQAQNTPLPTATSNPSTLASAVQLPADFTRKIITLDGERNDLAGVLAQIAQQSGHAILADDAPLRAQASMDGRDTLKAMLDKVGETFDYSWTVNADGVILLRKKFALPDDYPQMNLTELSQVVDDVRGALNTIAYDDDEDGAAEISKAALLKSLTPAQKQTILGLQPLRATDMTASQRQFITRIFANQMYGKTHLAWERLRTELNALPTGVLKTGDVREFSFGVKAYNADGKRVYPAMTRPGQPDWCGFFLAAPNRRDAEQNQWQLTTNDAMNKSQGRRNVPFTDEAPQTIPHGDADARLARAVTMPSAATDVQALLRHLSEQSGLAIRPARYLTEHRITVCAPKLSTVALLNALAMLEDWTWTREAPGHYVVARQNMRAPLNLTDVADVIRATLPRDWRAYFDIPLHPDRSIHLTPLAFARQLADERTQSLFKELGIARKSDPPAPVSRLTPAQKQMLLTALCFQTMHDTEEALQDIRRDMMQFEYANVSIAVDTDPRHGGGGSVMLEIHRKGLWGLGLTSVKELAAMP